jgi:hypothetical protein
MGTVMSGERRIRYRIQSVLEELPGRGKNRKNYPHPDNVKKDILIT